MCDLFSSSDISRVKQQKTSQHLVSDALSEILGPTPRLPSQTHKPRTNQKKNKIPTLSHTDTRQKRNLEASKKKKKHTRANTHKDSQNFPGHDRKTVPALIIQIRGPGISLPLSLGGRPSPAMTVRVGSPGFKTPVRPAVPNSGRSENVLGGLASRENKRINRINV